MSAEQIFDGLGPMLSRWTLGGSAIDEAPAQWQPVLEGCGPEEAELRLLALSGQFLDSLVTREPPRNLRSLSDLPALALPVMPEELRPLMRRCLKELNFGGLRHGLIRLLAVRGYTVHPADWLPAADERNVSEIYAPWCDWAAAKASGTAMRHTDADLSEESWADFGPAARCVAFAALRRRDRGRARALLAAKANGESAEIRTWLIDAMSIGLSADDIPYLQSLSGDRSLNVKRLADMLLERLGQSERGVAAAEELGGFFEVETAGSSQGPRTLKPLPIKTPAQREQRQRLFRTADFRAFANALGVEPEELVTIWPIGTDSNADKELLSMAGQSAPDMSIARLATRLENEMALDYSTINEVSWRLDPAQRKRLAYRFLESKGGRFDHAYLIVGPGSEMDVSLDSVAGRRTMDGGYGVELEMLGVIASHKSAISLLADLTKAGLAATDPRLDALRLNAALADTGSNS